MLSQILLGFLSEPLYYIFVFYLNFCSNILFYPFRYTYGKSVKGMVVLTIKRHYDWDFFDPKAIQTRFQVCF